MQAACHQAAARAAIASTHLANHVQDMRDALFLERCPVLDARRARDPDVFAAHPEKLVRPPRPQRFFIWVQRRGCVNWARRTHAPARTGSGAGPATPPACTHAAGEPGCRGTEQHAPIAQLLPSLLPVTCFFFF